MQGSSNGGLLSQPWRIGGFLGIATVVLFIVSIFLQGEPPMSTDSADDIRAFFADDGDTYLVGDFLIGLTLIFLFLPFAICLRSVLAQAEGGFGLLSTLFISGAILTLALGAAGAAGMGTLAVAAGDEDALDDATIKMLMHMSDYGFSGVSAGFGLTALSGAAVMAMTGVIAKWTGYLGLVAGVLSIVGAAWVIDGDPEGVLATVGFVGILVFAVWVLSTSIMMLRSKESAAAPAPAGV